MERFFSLFSLFPWLSVGFRGEILGVPGVLRISVVTYRKKECYA